MEFPKLSPFLGLIFRTLSGLSGRGTGGRHHLLPTTLNRTAPRSAAAPLPAAAAPRRAAERSGAGAGPRSGAARAPPRTRDPPPPLPPEPHLSHFQLHLLPSRIDRGGSGFTLPSAARRQRRRRRLRGRRAPAGARRIPPCAAAPVRVRGGAERSGAGRRARGEPGHGRERCAAGRGRTAG